MVDSVSEMKGGYLQVTNLIAVRESGLLVRHI